MNIWGHLSELRRRLMIALMALIATTLASFILAQKYLAALTIPIGGLEQVQSIEITENVGVFMRVSLLSGVILAMPVIVYELLAFIIPGLTGKERRGLLLAVPFASILFITGVAFAYFVMLPAAIPFLITFLGVKTVPRLSNYVEFSTNLMFWIGVSFETPLLVFVLAKVKIVNARALLKGWRIAIVAVAVLSAMITPTVDPVNMGLLMVPLFFLYLLSVFLAFIANRGAS